jgi:serine/threonine protein kinase
LDLIDDDDESSAPTGERAEFEYPTDASVQTTASSAVVQRDPLLESSVGGYRLEGVLGRGSAGIVYRAVHASTRRKAAFKVLKPELAQEPEYIRRLIEEAKALTTIRHPGIVDILDFGTLTNGQPYLVMELCDGLSLEEQLRFGGQPTLSETLDLLDELLAALGAAHEHGVIHRDVKPSNLFLATLPDGTRALKVLDFGLASSGDGRRKNRPTIPGTMVGTPDYMAPEQIDGRPMGPYTDVYAVGGIAFRLLSNTLPFVGPSGMAVLAKKMDQAPPHLRDVAPKTAPELDALVFQMLSRKFEDRPSVREARARFATHRNSLRPRASAALLDDDESVRPTTFHQFHDVAAAQGAILTASTAIDRTPPNPRPVRSTGRHSGLQPRAQPPNSSAPARPTLSPPRRPPPSARPTELEVESLLQAQSTKKTSDTNENLEAIDAISASNGQRWVLGMGLFVGALVLLGAGLWYALG